MQEVPTFFGRRRTSVALTVIALLGMVFFLRTRVELDDAFVYFRVVKNFLHGDGLVLNPGDAHLAVTSPLWTFLLAFFDLLTGPLELVLISKVLYTGFLCGAGYFLYDLTKDRLGIWAVLPALAVFFNSISLSCVGGEIALVYFALSGILWAYLKRRSSLLAGIFLGLGYLARGELVLVVVPLALHFLWMSFRQRTPKSEVVRWTLLFCGGAALIAVVWHLYYFLQFGNFFPDTLKAKMIQGRNENWTRFAADYPNHVRQAFNSHFSLALLLPFGAWFAPVPVFILSAFTLLHFLAYSFLGVPNYHWYYYDLEFLVLLLAFLGVPGVWTFLMEVTGKFLPPVRGSETVRATYTVGTFLSLLFVFNLLTGASHWTFLPDPGERYRSYVRVADFLNQNMRDSDILLTDEIGIIGYYLKQGTIRDVNGLASPGVTDQNMNDWNYFINVYSPRFLVLHKGNMPEGLVEKTPTGWAFFRKVFVSMPNAISYKGTVFERTD